MTDVTIKFGPLPLQDSKRPRQSTIAASNACGLYKRRCKSSAPGFLISMNPTLKTGAFHFSLHGQQLQTSRNFPCRILCPSDIGDTYPKHPLRQGLSILFSARLICQLSAEGQTSDPHRRLDDINGSGSSPSRSFFPHEFINNNC
jgi:hypothetical protein